LPKKTGSIQIRRKPEDVSGFVREAQANADSNRDALGFLPSQAYEQAASQGTLFIASQATADGGERYAGHILFGASYPHARIYQLFVAPASRANGIGRMLIESLVEFTEAKQYLSVIAKVADDLSANGFYKALGFETLGTKAGGASRGRTINIRVRQLNTPALFGYRWPVSGLPLAELPSSSTPVFVIDLNVFFDVARRRPRAEAQPSTTSSGFW
jgi:ribosomal protein S18 acetylase RimI-like enzyme